MPLKLDDTFEQTPLIKTLVLDDHCDAIEFVQAHAEDIQECINQHGGILIRGCKLAQESDLQTLAEILYGPCLSYIGGVSPRAPRKHQVYNSTYLAQDMVIPQHREMSYLPRSPDRVTFYCQHPAVSGGETPITDFSQVYQHLVNYDADYMKHLEEVGVFLNRVYFDSDYLRDHFGIPSSWGWQESFGCSTLDELDLIGEKMQVTFKHCPGYAAMLIDLPISTLHPVKNIPVFYPNFYLNKRTLSKHFQLSEASIQYQKAVANIVRKEDNDIYAGDKWLVPERFIDQFHQAVLDNTYAFEWRANDLLLIDNNLLAHGRYTFTGNQRSIWVCLNNL